MCKKLILLTVVLVFGFVNVNKAAEIMWTGAGADNLWTNPANWEGNKVPAAADRARIEAPGALAPNGPVIQEGMDLEINRMYNEAAGEPVLTITGGTLTISGWGIWWGDGPGCKPTLYMSGGTLSLTGGPGIFEFGWGGGGGTVIMTGGTINAKGVNIPADDGSGIYGELYLHGGTVNIGTSRGGLLMYDNGLIDITEGTLVLEGDETAKINDYIADGKITFYSGGGEFELDYDTRNPGMTTLTAKSTGKAYNPDPTNGSIYENIYANLSWVPGEQAVSHDVYLGEDHDKVANGTGDTFKGNTTDNFFIIGIMTTPYPDGLVPGTTYYWRIDEVEANGTVQKGNVWSFMITPNEAFNPFPADGAESVELDSDLTLDMDLIWRPGFGALFHTVYFGEDYDTVNTATGGTEQSETYFAPSGPLANERVYYWRVDESDALTTHKGDVWGFTTPGAAGNPQPSNGAADVQMNKTLSWTPAATASSHDLYFGTNKDAVRNATTASPEYQGSKALGSESHDPGKLAWHSPYYWRVDAVYAGSANPVKGLVWTFTTADFLTVDDFEAYNDINPGEPGSNRILEAWAYGIGTTTNGSVVGHDLPPYAERTIVHGGIQSMPYSYDNNLKYSEATKTLTYPRDWTAEGVATLSLWFRGKAANAAEPMYVALNDSAPVYHDNANATQATNWQEWSIPLQKFADLGVDLANVNSIAIGFGTPGNTTTAGGSGEMYFDDIRLYRPAAAPMDPSLAAWWELDENTDDSSGNGHTGITEGAPTWVSPGRDGTGSCMQFGGDSDRITVDSFDVTGSGITLAAWINPTSLLNDARMVSKSQGSGTADHYWAMILSGSGEDNLEFRLKTDTGATTRRTSPEGSDVLANEWNHVAVTWDAGDPVMRLYKNGIEIDSVSKGGSAVATAANVKIGIGNQSVSAGPVAADMTRPFGGLIDDVRVYDRGLSPAEILELAAQ